jgi:hypothetical protein
MEQFKRQAAVKLNRNAPRGQHRRKEADENRFEGLSRTRRTRGQPSEAANGYAVLLIFQAMYAAGLAFEIVRALEKRQEAR